MSKSNLAAHTPPQTAENPTLRLVPAPSHRSGTSVYVSWDEIERADAFQMGYDAVCQHPNEVGPLGTGDELVLDGNNILFGDFDVAARVAADAARNGVEIGVHTYNSADPRLAPVLALPGVVVAKTHADVRTAMRRLRAAG